MKKQRTRKQWYALNFCTQRAFKQQDLPHSAQNASCGRHQLSKERRVQKAEPGDKQLYDQIKELCKAGGLIYTWIPFFDTVCSARQESCTRSTNTIRNYKRYFQSVPCCTPAESCIINCMSRGAASGNSWITSFSVQLLTGATKFGVSNVGPSIRNKCRSRCCRVAAKHYYIVTKIKACE